MAEKQKDHGLGESAIQAKENIDGTWIPLVDWSLVYPGNRGVNRHGLYDLYDAPVGVQLKVEEGLKTDPILIAEEGWEMPPGGGAIIEPLKIWKQDGWYHLLYFAHPSAPQVKKSDALVGSAEMKKYGGMGYAVSDDGYHWTRPELGQVEFEGSRKNNRLANSPTGGPCIDPTAPPEERFKALGQEGGPFDPETGRPLSGEEAYKRMKAMEYEGPAYQGPKMVARHWISGWTSPDGIHWKKIEKPLADMPSDCSNAAHYDPETQTYFAYVRMGGMGRRAVGLAKTKDFWHWSDRQLVLAPDPQDDPDVSFYAGDFFRYPGRNDVFGMFLQIYHQITDHCDTQIAFSRDGMYWYRPERRAAIPVGPPGSGEDCQVRSFGGLVELPDGYWATPYRGESWLHNSRGVMPITAGQARLARWRPHRFCGIEARQEGQFSISTIGRKKNELRLNFRCAPGGWISAELIHNIPSRLHPDADPIPGFSFAESDRLSGDSLDQVVTWKGKSDLSTVGECMAIRIKMFQAKLYAFSI
jgi:hypothetical protein